MYAGPGPGQNPFPGAMNAPPPSPGVQAYNDTAKALSIQSQGNTFVYLVELKKLCLSIMQADEITKTLQHRGDKVDRPAIFRQELQNQILSFALMRVLPPEQVKEASEAANRNYLEGQVQNPPLSPSGLFLRELESRAGDNEQVAKAVEAELIKQPLFHMVSRSPEMFAGLEQHYSDTAESGQQLLRSVNQSIGLLNKVAANPPAPAANMGPTPP